MKQLLKLLSLAVVAIAFVAPDAEARRLSGGRSFGQQREIVKPPAAAPSAPAATPAAPPPAGNRWLAPVAGLLAGLGLGALFANGGFGAVLGGLLVVAFLFAALVVAGKLAMRFGGNAAPAGRPQPVTFGSGGPPEAAPSPGAAGSKPWFQPGPAATAGAAPVFPPDFDATAFARHAKLNFTRLQKAYDDADVSALRDVMTDDVYREIESDLSRSAPGATRTEVVDLDAQVLEVVTEGNHYVASVRFSGLLREGTASPEPFRETWHLHKPRVSGGGWLLAGIQQD
jgi:predicted lipid-binding transport protein (Tim44 family)